MLSEFSYKAQSCLPYCLGEGWFKLGLQSAGECGTWIHSGGCKKCTGKGRYVTKWICVCVWYKCKYFTSLGAWRQNP